MLSWICHLWLSFPSAISYVHYVCRYDYSGYGQSTGKVSAGYFYIQDSFPLITKWIIVLGCLLKLVCCLWLQPSEHNTYADIEAAYKCLEESYGAKQEDIILYGQSVGSGPTVDLAARLHRLRAVVLHSPILSGLRVMYPVKRTYWFDIYKVNAWLETWTTQFSHTCQFNQQNFFCWFFAEHWQNSLGEVPCSSYTCKWTYS